MLCSGVFRYADFFGKEISRNNWALWSGKFLGRNPSRLPGHGGGMLLEFFAWNFDENFIMVGHDGPSNVNVAKDKPVLQNLTVHHGKTGEGLGIDFNMAEGPCPLLNLTQFGKIFKQIYSVGEVISGDVLNIGNPNCRVRVRRPIPEFFNAWVPTGFDCIQI